MHIKHEKDFIVVIIEDIGSVIPATELEKVFEPFYHVEQSRSRETGGISLGLTLVKNVI